MRLLVFQIFTMLFVALPGLKASVADPATLTAVFSNQPSTPFRVVTNQSLTNEWAGDQLAAGMTDKDGKFNTKIGLNEETQIIVFVGPSFYKIWMQPGGVLTVQQGQAGLEFNGTVAKQNQFMYRAGLTQPFNVNHSFDKQFQPQEVTAWFDSIEIHRWRLYQLILKDEKLSQKFRDYCEGQITGFTVFSLSQYPMKFIYIEKSMSFKDVSSSYYAFWKKFRLLSTDPGSDMYHNALRDYVSFLALKQNSFDISSQEKLTEIQLQITDSLLIDHPQTLAAVKAVQIDFLIKYFDYHNLTRTAFDKYAGQFPGTPATLLLTKKWNTKNKITFSIPSFTLRNNEGKQVSLHDLKGNIVYIDFWGSWCKACLTQMPASLGLQQKFAGEKIVFLYIDFYDSKEKWLQAINNYKISGLHLKAEKQDEEYFNDHFGINQGFPRYAIIDKAGKLVTTAAPHPGDERAITFIKELLSP